MGKPFPRSPDRPVAASANPPWPGFTAGNDARCLCTWALKNGVYQVKHAHADCPNRRLHESGEGRP